MKWEKSPHNSFDPKNAWLLVDRDAKTPWLAIIFYEGTKINWRLFGEENYEASSIQEAKEAALQRVVFNKLTK